MSGDADALQFRPADPRSSQVRWALESYFAELAERFPEGFDPGDTIEADADHYEPPHGVFVLACQDDDIAACGAVQTLGERVAEIKRMWVAPAWRGRGLGRRMLAELERHAEELGNDRVRLDTNSALEEAIRMYETSGYRSIERYNDNPYAKRWFEKSLSG